MSEIKVTADFVQELLAKCEQLKNERNELWQKNQEMFIAQAATEKERDALKQQVEAFMADHNTGFWVRKDFWHQVFERRDHWKAKAESASRLNNSLQAISEDTWQAMEKVIRAARLCDSHWNEFGPENDHDESHNWLNEALAELDRLDKGEG